MTFEEVAKIIAEEWENLPDENKTPYRERADEERLRHEAVSAALVLTQIGTPPLRSLPATPVPRSGQRARRCLDIGTSDWQSPRAPRHADGSPSSGYHDEFDFDPDLGGIFTDAQVLLANTYSSSSSSLSHMFSDGFSRSGGRNAGGRSANLGDDGSGARQALSAAAGSFAWSSPAPPPSVGSPCGPSPLSRDPDGRTRSPGSAGYCSVDGYVATNRRGHNKSPPAHTSTTPAAGAAGTTLRTPGSGGHNGGGEGDGKLIARVGLEVRAAGGAKESMSENQEGYIRGSSQALPCEAWGRVAAPEKGEVEAAAAAVPGRAAASHKRRKASFSTPSSISSPPVSSSSASSSVQQGFSASESTSSSWTAAAAAAAQKNGKSDRNGQRAQDKIRKAECKTGRQLVSKMSKKDAARPKGPQSSYIWFYKERVASMKAAKPSVNIMDVGTRVGEAWRRLPKEMKLPYTELAQADRKRYERELRAIARNALASAAASPTISAPNADNVVAATDATDSLSTP